uniref:Uncharacterized protein n=1 Tax=Panagrolaimus sp. ES5 TaxID=591445 RepID=A0AC34GL93_9BILA
MINKATARAEITQETYISKSETYKGEATMDAYKAEKHTTSNITTTSILRTRGGPDIERLSGAKPNESMLYVENLVGMKQSGKYIYQIISAIEFSKFSLFVKYTVQNLIYNATQDYYNFNNRLECMDVESENYNPI